MTNRHVNPIIRGFGPDPSICLVDGTYYLANSTFHLFPGLPIYASKDLISWTLIGNAINRKEQLNLVYTGVRVCPQEKGATLLAIGGLHAPTIRHRDGIFYIVCTNVTHSDPADPSMKFHNFIISTRDIWASEWSNPIAIDLNGFDPDLFFDDDGKAYIQGGEVPGPHLKIIQYEVNLSTGAKLSPKKVIHHDTSDFYGEGPHIYKKDDWYYLMIAEGGTHERHNVKIARSRNISGPFATYERNPLVTAYGTNEYVQHVGHADLFQDVNGNWWYVCLGVRKADERYVMGRETFLMPCEWPKDGWPSLSRPQLELPAGTPIPKPASALPATRVKNADFLVTRDGFSDKVKVSEDGQAVTITPGTTDFYEIASGIRFVGKRQPDLVGTASVIMTIPKDIQCNVKAGLALYKDELRYARIYFETASSEVVAEVVNTVDSIAHTTRHFISAGDTIGFQLWYTETSYELSYRAGSGSVWTPLHRFDTLVMTAFDFGGPVIGPFALAMVEDPSLQVYFEQFQVSQS